MTLKHRKVTAIPDDAAYDVGSDEWNDDHVLSTSTGQVLYDSGQVVTGSAAFIYSGSGALTLGLASTTTGSLIFGHASSAFGTTVQAPNASAAHTLTLPNVTDTLAVLGANTFTAAQTFNASAGAIFPGSSSGTATLLAPAAAGTSTITLPGVTATLATLGANTFTALQTITQASANAGILASTGYSLTGSDATNAISLTGTWNTSGNPVMLNIAMTNTASGATTKFINCLAGAAGATSVFSVDKNGVTTITSPSSTATGIAIGQIAVAGWYLGMASGNGDFAIGQSSMGSVYVAVVNNSLGQIKIGSANPVYLTGTNVAATLQQGAPDAATAVAQTLKVQSVVAGTSSVAGAAWTLRGSLSTGAALSGDIILKTGDTGASATVQNAAITGLTIKGGTAAGLSGSVIIGSAAIATTATDGFLYIPTCAGTPAGTPTAVTGRVALIYDTTNKQFWIYDGAWLQPKTPAAAAIVNWQ